MDYTASYNDKKDLRLKHLNLADQNSYKFSEVFTYADFINSIKNVSAAMMG